MANRATLTDVAGGASLNPTTYNANNATLEAKYDLLLGRGGVSENNNSLTNDLDFDGNTGRNLKTPASDGDIIIKGYGDANYGGTAATDAAASAVAAATAQTGAETAESAAVVAQTAAELAETNAETAETNAETAETGAEAAQAAAEATIGQAKVSSDDTTGGFLDGKLTADSTITFTVGSPAGDETLDIAVANPFTAADETKLDGIEALADVNIDLASQAEAEAGTEATKTMTPLQTAQAIAVLSPAAAPGQWELFKVEAVTSDNTDPWKVDGLDLDADEEYLVVVHYVRSEFGTGFDWAFYINDDNASSSYDYRFAIDGGAFASAVNGNNTIILNNAESFNLVGSHDTFHLMSGVNKDTIQFTRFRGNTMGLSEMNIQYEGSENITELTFDTEGLGLDIGSIAWVYRRRQAV